MKNIGLIGAALILAPLLFYTQRGSERNFSGTWVLDKNRSFSNPAGLEQTMVISLDSGILKLDANVKTSQGEQKIQENWNLDGIERSFVPDGAKPGAKGNRRSYWLPEKRGIILVDERTTPGQDGPVNQIITRKLTLSADGNALTVDYFNDSPRGQYEAKRVFIRQ